MNRPLRIVLSLVLSASLAASGCAPQQPFYCREDGDLSHYLDVATEIEYPDVEEPSLCEVTNTLPPLTLKNTENYEMWDLPLEEAVQITLCNSQVMRQLGGRVQSTAPETISRTLISPVAVTTTYDPALVESTTGLSVGSPFQGSGTGSRPERIRCAARCQRVLGKDSPAAEPAGQRHRRQYSSRRFWPRNRAISPPASPRRPPTGTRVRSSQQHDLRSKQCSADRSRPLPSAWTDELRSHVQSSVVAGQRRSIQPHRRPDEFRGHMRPGWAIRSTACDRADSHGSDAGRLRRRRAKPGARRRRRVLGAVLRVSRPGCPQDGPRQRTGNLEEDGGAFTAPVRAAAAPTAKPRLGLAVLPVPRPGASKRKPKFSEMKIALRYIMGLSMSDGRLIRPSDEPTTARVAFDWAGIHTEALIAPRGNSPAEVGNQAARVGTDRRPQLPVAATRCGRPLSLAGPGRRVDQSKQHRVPQYGRPGSRQPGHWLVRLRGPHKRRVPGMAARPAALDADRLPPRAVGRSSPGAVAGPRSGNSSGLGE